MKCLKLRVAKAAGEITATQPHKYGGMASKWPFTLECAKNRNNFERLTIVIFWRSDGIFAEHGCLRDWECYAYHPMKKQKSTKSAMPALETNLVHGGSLRSQFGEVSEAIFLNSGFTYDSAETAEKRFNGEEPGYVYSRYRNPSLAMLEDRLALLEGAESCIAVGSGMAAVFASLMSILKAGDRVVANRVLFGSCHYIITELLPRFGIRYELVNGDDKTAWEKALSRPARAVFIESPANPNLELTDIAHVVRCAKKVKATVIVDNVFATPLYQRPLALGADMVIYSTTKYFDGQGRTLGGAILGSKKLLEGKVMPFHRHTGPALSPFNAWVVLKGLETLPMRMERHVANAERLADILNHHSKVASARYPFHPSFPQVELARAQMKTGGALIAIDLKNKRNAFNFLNGLNIVSISNNLGDAKSLATHPATTTHSNLSATARRALGIGEGLVRLSVGIEAVADLERDIIAALAEV